MSRPVAGSTELCVERIQRFFSQGIKHPGRNVDHSSASSTEIKNESSCNSAYPIDYDFMAWTETT
jgi:hypothetical protein